jgi:hypothetical protein
MPASVFASRPWDLLLSMMYPENDCPPRIECGAHYFRTTVRHRTGKIGLLQIGFAA